MCEVCKRGEASEVIKDERILHRLKFDNAVNGVAHFFRQGKHPPQQAIDRAAAAWKELEAFEEKVAAFR